MRLISFHILSNSILDIIYITEMLQSDEGVDICNTSSAEILKFVKCIAELENLVSSKYLYATSCCNIQHNCTLEDTATVKHKL